MERKTNRIKLFIRISATLACSLWLCAQAASITNGGFESGLAGWTRADQLGSEGTFALQTGAVSPPFTSCLTCMSLVTDFTRRTPIRSRSVRSMCADDFCGDGSTQIVGK